MDSSSACRHLSEINLFPVKIIREHTCVDKAESPYKKPPQRFVGSSFDWDVVKPAEWEYVSPNIVVV